MPMHSDFTDEQLRRALIIAMNLRMEQLPAEYELPHVFSRRFKRKMRILIREAWRPKALNLVIRYAKRAAVIVLATLTVSFATVMSVEALRVKFFELLMETYEKYTEIFAEKDEAGLAPAIFVHKAPTYIPDGFELVWEDYNESVHMDYQNKAGQSISFSQLPMERGRMRINTENIRIDLLEINGYEAYYYFNLGFHSIVWHDGHYSYQLDTDLDKAEALKIAESTKQKNF